VPGSTPCMAGATNPGNIGHAWVKALWVDKVPPPGCEGAEQYDPNDYDFIRARIEDNPIFANDKNYLKSLGALPEKLRCAFLEGNWDVFAGQYFDIFEMERHTARAGALGMQWWWPRWISIDWGLPSSQRGLLAYGGAGDTNRGPRDARPSGPRIITYREFLKNSLSPRMLGQAIAELSNGERIGDVFLSPDAFANHMSEATIAEQLGDVLEQNGLPRPTPAENDRVGGWQLMYQLLETDDWMITDNCHELIECLPTLVRDERKVEDVRKVEGDDAADAARYGLVSGVRYAGFGAHSSAPDKFGAASARFTPGVP
jgi:phage terminase large subunit